MIRVFLVFLLTLPLFGEINITKEWLQEKPRSSYKDFYIWRYLNKEISPQEAIWALGEAKNVNNKLFYRYAKKLKHTETSRIVSCMKMSQTKIIHEDSTCIKLGLTPYKATKLSHKELHSVIEKIKNEYPKMAQIFTIVKSPMPFQDLINSEAEIFYGTFLEVGGVYRRTHFNHHLHTKTLKKIESDTKNFKRFIRKVVLSPKLNKLQESLLQVDAKNLDHKSQFYLAINAIKHKKYKLALNYLDASSKTAYFKFDKDKVDFWRYKLTNNKSILETLAKSWDINIYSLYAKEHTNEKITNSVFEFPNTTTTESKYNLDNPFLWLKVLKESKKMDKSKMESFENLFNSKLLSGHLAFVQERFFNYKKSFYPSPYDEYISQYSKQRQALINAIARQESRFIPTSISHSYAMGVMQIMPFLSKALAKEMKEKYDIDKQLDAATNLRYAHRHLNWLEKRLSHPLFIAYAYNGGIGFTNRMLKSGIFKKGKYEPYLSMELVPYDESKRYGKKVLANYVMYYNHTHKAKISITSLLQNLTKPHQ